MLFESCASWFWHSVTGVNSPPEAIETKFKQMLTDLQKVIRKNGKSQKVEHKKKQKEGNYVG